MIISTLHGTVVFRPERNAIHGGAADLFDVGWQPFFIQMRLRPRTYSGEDDVCMSVDVMVSTRGRHTQGEHPIMPYERVALKQ